MKKSREAEIERKFTAITEAIKDILGTDEPNVIVMTQDGAILMGSPLELTMIHKSCDRAVRNQLDELKPKAAEELLDRLENGCGNPDCKLHGGQDEHVSHR